MIYRLNSKKRIVLFWQLLAIHKKFFVLGALPMQKKLHVALLVQ